MVKDYKERLEVLKEKMKPKQELRTMRDRVQFYINKGKDKVEAIEDTLDYYNIPDRHKDYVRQWIMDNLK